MRKIESKVIKGYPDYTITSKGDVISYRQDEKGKVLKPSVSTGYQKVCLQGKSSKQNFQVHRLVALAFLKKPKGFNIVNHIDGNKLNNSLSNLEWTNRKGNGKHYGEKLAPKYRAERVKMKHDDLAARLSIISHAKTACTANPQLFQSVVDAALMDMKI